MAAVRCLGISLALCAACLPMEKAQAQQCTAAETARALPNATSAMDAWVRTNNVAMTYEARDQTLRRLCMAAATMSQDGGVALSEINAVVPEVLNAYLDDNNSNTQTRSLFDLIDAHFALNSSPIHWGPRQLGRIQIAYRQSVDSIEVGGRRMPRYESLMSEVGQVTIAGFAASHQLCRGVVTVSPVAPALFTC